MLQRFKIAIYATLVLHGVLNPAAQADTSALITMRFCHEDQEYSPFVIASSNHQTALGQNGILPDLVIKTTQRLGIQTEFVHYPWKRCIALLKAGEVDGIFAAIWQKERDDWGVFPKSTHQADPRYSLQNVKYSIYTNPKSNLNWNGTQFTNVRIGISAPLGYIAEQRLRKMGVLSRNSYTPQEGLRLVSLNRLDAFIVESNIGDHIVHQLGIEQNVKVLPIPFMTTDWYLPLSHQWVKTNPSLAKKFWETLATVRNQEGQQLQLQYSLR